jgi:hypothetical protein
LDEPNHPLRRRPQLLERPLHTNERVSVVTGNLGAPEPQHIEHDAIALLEGEVRESLPTLFVENSPSVLPVEAPAPNSRPRIRGVGGSESHDS